MIKESNNKARLTISLSLSYKIARLLQEKKIENIIVIDLSELVSYTDTFVIGTAQTDIQSRVSADWVIEKLKAEHVIENHIEGYEEGRWVLLDYIDVVVHIFLPETRKYFNLESLWGDAPCYEIGEANDGKSL